MTEQMYSTGQSNQGLQQPGYTPTSTDGATMSALSNPDAFDLEYLPDEIVNRNQEQTALTTILSDDGGRNIYIHGPRGTGKTLLIRRTLNQLSATATCYLPCTKYDTEYKVLKCLYRLLTDEEVSNGYHTAQLQGMLEPYIGSAKTAIVLDDMEFLLKNDGSDLLYYLSRTKQSHNLHVVGISSNYPDLEEVIDERTYSSLRPMTVPFDPYTETEIQHILTNRANDALAPGAITREAIETIARDTNNARFALQWLERAARSSEERITADTVDRARPDAVQRYRGVLLQDFTCHHYLLLEAIEQLSTHAEAVQTGPVYDQYRDLCESTGKDPFSHRTASTFLDHLELLDIISVERFVGGRHGKTRMIQLKNPV